VSFTQKRMTEDRTSDELLERCLGEDGAAWEDLVKEHSRRVYGLCYRFTRKHSDAQDLTQDVFLRVFQTLGTFRSAESSFTGWLIRITRNLLIDNYRRSGNDRVTWSIEDQDGIEWIATSAELPDQALAWREANDLLQASLARLSPELREPIVFSDLEELKYRETAVILGIPEGTVKSRLNRGRAELAKVMRRYRPQVG
jgi:RNA polymerase sigma-70 factor, ECF subfamily